MKFIVTAKIENSPIIPLGEITAEKEFEFSEDSNVFGRVYDVRTYFKRTYKTDDVEIIKVKQMKAGGGAI